MFNIHSVEIDWGGRPLRLETGKIARQADGAVLATYGETVVLATVVAAKTPREGVDFLPLTVDYQEKTYAAGRIPGGYFKREGRPTEKETLVSRLIDRPIRPLFVDGWRNETQVIVTVLSHDMENDPDILALVAASAALTLSGRSLQGPDRRRARRLHQRRIRAQPDAGRNGRHPARSGRRRHRRRRADGGIGSQGAQRGHHAWRRDVRTPAFPARGQRDHRARREGREGAARSQGRRRKRAGKGNPGADRDRSARRLRHSGQAGPLRRGRQGQGKGDGALFPGRPGAEIRQAAHRRRVQGTGSQDRSLEHPRHRQAHRRPRFQDRAPDHRRSRRAARAPTARRCSPAARRRRWS